MPDYECSGGGRHAEGSPKSGWLSQKQRPTLLSDNGPCFISGELQGWLKEHGLGHPRSKPYHPMTQGKIERLHRSLKNRIILEHYYLPIELERQINVFVTHYNERRYHESLDNLTPEDIWCRRGHSILKCRRNIFLFEVYPVNQSINYLKLYLRTIRKILYLTCQICSRFHATHSVKQRFENGGWRLAVEGRAVSALTPSRKCLRLTSPTLAGVGFFVCGLFA